MGPFLGRHRKTLTVRAHEDCTTNDFKHCDWGRRGRPDLKNLRFPASPEIKHDSITPGTGLPRRPHKTIPEGRDSGMVLGAAGAAQTSKIDDPRPAQIVPLGLCGPGSPKSQPAGDFLQLPAFDDPTIPRGTRNIDAREADLWLDSI